MFSHDVGVPLLHSTAIRVGQIHFLSKMLSGTRSRSLYDRYLLTSARHIVLLRVCAPHLHPPVCGLMTGPSCTAHTASYHVHLVYTSIPCTQNCAILLSDVSYQNTRTPGCSRTIVPSCSASSGSYCILLMCIPARKTVLYYSKLEFSKFTM